MMEVLRRKLKANSLIYKKLNAEQKTLTILFNY